MSSVIVLKKDKLYLKNKKRNDGNFFMYVHACVREHEPFCLTYICTCLLVYAYVCLFSTTREPEKTHVFAY
jgi:hypothetical protein